MPYLQSMRLALLAGIALTAAPVAQAADLGAAPPEPTENWTGFYVGGGAGVGFFSTDVSTSSSRTDQIGFCQVKDGKKECEEKKPEYIKYEKEKDQKYDKHDKKFDPFATLFQSQSTNSDLGDEGFFGTVQLGYDKQFAPRWLIGVFVDGDLYSNVEADSHSSSSSSLNINIPYGPKFDIPLSKLTTDTNIGLDWTISVGGRLGVLATPGTLLYVLGAYTHAELDKSRVNVSIDDPAGSLGEFFHQDIDSPTKIALNLPDSLNGFSLGAGTEAKLGHGPWSIKLEYRWSHFEGDSAKGSSSDSQCIPIDKWKGIGREIEGNASASYDDVDIQSVRGVLTYRFGGAPDEVASLK